MTTNAPNTAPIYAEAASDGGRLVFVDGIPVLCVGGPPATIGRQVANLALRPAARLLDYPLDYLNTQVKIPLLPRLLWWGLRRRCERLYQNIPERYRAEIEAMAGCGLDRRRLVAANTLFDVTAINPRPPLGCSSWLAPPASGRGLLLGRNLDFFPLGYLHAYSLLSVYAPSADALGFASVGFPGVVGCFSGINQAGLCLVRHEVFSAAVPATHSLEGEPFAVCCRRVLERCRSVDEAVEALAATRHAAVSIVAVADADGGAIVEIAPGGVKARPIGAQLRGCTNHFTHPDWRNSRQANAYHTLDRLARLEAMAADDGVEAVRQALDAVHQGELTLQTMVFEPAAVAVHLAFGQGPTTRRPLTRIALAPYWQPA